jgi:L-alanine-DL-glutamate epimerase-like enolase superfamily enzyme
MFAGLPPNRKSKIPPMRIVDCTLHRTDVRLRMPFRYGIATMTEGPVIFVRLQVEINGKTKIGISSDLLPAKWFTKIPAQSIAEEVAGILRVIRHAAATGIGLEDSNVFEIWRQLYEAQTAWASQEAIPPLLANFGVSLVERALIEAAAKATGQTFAQMLQSNELGMRLDWLHPELAGVEPRDFLGEPRPNVVLRHTVGLADPLAECDITDAERLDDGLPQSLEASIRAYGLRHFKIKVNGKLEADLERVSRCAEIIARWAPADFAFSLDGNEQFESLDQFRAFWDKAQGRPELRAFLNHLLFVEQPLHRKVALEADVAVAFRHWPNRPPVIIDESDGTTADFRLALELGYAGTSHKNCKGIFKGTAHRCLIESRRRKPGSAMLMMSGEDLCNTGPIALLQDLAVMAALGIESVERNGHHYHAGLSQFPEPVQTSVLRLHGDLYQASPARWPTLRVEDGRLNLHSINQSPFGVGFELDCGLFPHCSDSSATIQ